jgi:hypothetical protein
MNCMNRMNRMKRMNFTGFIPARIRCDGSWRSPKTLIGDPRGERGAVSDK